MFAKRDASSQKNNLWLANIETGEIRNLNIATIPSKAVWNKDSSFIVAGVPTTGNAGNGLTQDTIKKVILAN